MFDTQSVVVNTVTVPLAKVSMNGRASQYENADGSLKLTISHSNGNRNRSVVRLDRKKVGADALNPATNKQYIESTYLVTDSPLTGFTDDELRYDIVAIADLIKSTGWTARFLGQES